MASKARVRVELKQYNNNPNYDEREQAWKRLWQAFNNAVQDSGVLNTYKEKSTYESKSRKLRRKRRESEVTRLKAMLKENLLQGKTYEH